MARIRSIKPEFFQDQDLAVEVPSRDARLLYIGLWGVADEHGRLRGDAVWVKGQVYPYDLDLTPEAVDVLLDMLEVTGRAVRYRIRNSVYLFLPKIAAHQRLEPHKVPSRLPDPPDDLLQQFCADSSEKNSDESAQRENLSTLQQAAGSRVHVASSSARAAPRDHRPPPGAEEAAQLILDATGCTTDLAAETVLSIHRERKPHNLGGYVRTIINAGKLGPWLTKAQKTIASSSTRAAQGRAIVSPTRPMPTIASGSP